MNIKEIRQQYPQYEDLTDEQIAKGLHQKYYSDLDFDDFSNQIGFNQSEIQPGKTFVEGAKDVARNTLTFLSSANEARARALEQSGNPGLAEKVRSEGQKDVLMQQLNEKWIKPDGTLKRPDGFKGYIQDIVRMSPQIGAQTIATVAGGPVAGGFMMATQIAGSDVQRLEAEGVDPERAWKAALGDAFAQAPLEQIGLGKALKFWKPGKAAARVIRGLIESGGTEFLTEWAQKYPELMAEIWAKGKDKSPNQLLDEFTEGFAEATKQGIYEGAVAAPFGALTGGIGGLASSTIETTKPGMTEAGLTPPDIKTVGQDERIEMIRQGLASGQVTIETARALQEAAPEGLAPRIQAVIDEFTSKSVQEKAGDAAEQAAQQTQPDLFPRQTSEEQAKIEQDILKQRAPKDRLQAFRESLQQRINAEKSDKEIATEEFRAGLKQRASGQIKGREVDQAQLAKELRKRLGLPEPTQQKSPPPGQGFELKGEPYTGVQNAEEIRRKAEETSQQEGTQGGEEGRLRLRDIEGNGLETEAQQEKIDQRKSERRQEPIDFGGAPVIKQAPPVVNGEVQPERRITGERRAEQKKQVHDYSNTQINIPKKEADIIRDFSSKIPENEIYTEPGDDSYGREENPHVTVRYGLDTVNPDDVAPAFEGIGPIKAKMGKVSIFETDNYDVVKVDIDSIDLRKANKKVGEAVDLPGETFKDYIPHATIAYVKKGEGKKYIGDKSFEGKEFTVNEIVLSGKDGKNYPIKLGDKLSNTKLELTPSQQASVNKIPEATRIEFQKEAEKHDAKLIGFENGKYWLHDNKTGSSGNLVSSVDEIGPKITENRKAFEDINKKLSPLKKTLKNQTGSSELANDVLRHAADLIIDQKVKFQEFTKSMRQKFSDIWEKIKPFMVRIWNDIRKSVSNQKGEVVIKKADFDKMFDDLVAKRVKPPIKGRKKYAQSVNVEKQDIGDEAKNIERTIAKEKQTISWVETESKSDQTLRNSKKLASSYKHLEKISKGKLTAEIDAAREVNAALAAKMSQQLNDFKDGKLTKDELREALEQYAPIFETTSEASSEIGRALNIHKKMVSPERIFRAYQKIKDTANKRQLDLIHDATEKLLSGELTRKELELIEKELPDPTISEYIMEYWYNCILSGPPTHVVNIASNTGWSLFQIPHKMLVSGIDNIYSRFTGKERIRYLNETIPMLAGYKMGFSRGAKAAKEVFLYEKITSFDDKLALETGYVKSAFSRSPNAALRKFGKIITIPTKALRAMDVWANSIAYDGSIMSQARRKANKEGLKGEKLKLREKAILEQWAHEMPIDVHQTAIEDAQYTTFTNAPDRFTQSIASLRNVKGIGPWIRLVVPFVNTISNLTKRGIEMTPGLGILKESISRKMGRGNATQEVIAKQIEGAVLSFYILSLAAQGLISGPMPEKKQEREAWYRQGKKPWSIKIGGTWYQYRRIEPFNSVIAVASSFYDKIVNAKDDATAEDMMFDFIKQVQWNIMEGSYFAGLQKVFNRYDSRKGVVAQTLASFVPFSSFWRSLNRAFEVATEGSAKAREGNDWLMAFSSVIPGIPSKMPAKLDVWGEESVIPGGVFRQWLPYKWAEEIDDNVEIELEKIGLYPGLPRKFITFRGNKIELDEQTYRSFAIDYGKQLKKTWKRMINSRGWNNYSNEVKKTMLSKTRAKVSKMMRARLLQKMPKDILTAKK